VAPKLFVLVPPSEAKAPGGVRAARPGAFDESLHEARERTLDALARLMNANPHEWEKALRVRGPLLGRALAATELLVERRAHLLPAWRRYHGVVWSHLDPSTLTIGERRRVLVPSGLYGVTTAADPIADYRLRMDVSIIPLGNLAAFWRPRLSPVIAAHVGKATLVNLLPGQHAAAIDAAMLAERCRVVDVDFVGADGSGAVGHDAKAVKGVVARRLLRQGLASLDDFEWEGWRSEKVGEKVRLRAPRESVRARSLRRPDVG
jgi:cytoplasmic iron level regulating protein YaaA (DUF328/UPF0246 family)